MRARFFQAPGVSFRAISLPGSQARGVEIDNASGSWLYIPSLETFIAPYTVGWSYGFPYGVSALDIIAGTSPAGQVSTTQGDGVTVYLTDQETVSSSGAAGSPDGGQPFVTGFTPQISVVVGASGVVGGSTNVPIAGGVTGKRIRLRTLGVSLGATGSMVTRRPDWNGCEWEIRDAAVPNQTLEIGGYVNGLAPHWIQSFSDLGVVGAVGNGLVMDVNPDFLHTTLIVSLQYELI